MRIARTRQELAAALEGAQSTGLVMTMGALHQGHLSLVKEAQKHADTTIVSIFVNPTQFAAGEDFDTYPRTEEDDLKALKEAGCDIVYLPTVDEIYTSSNNTSIDPGPMARVLEGEARPTHFAGVALVVTKMLNQVRPDVAVFGQKDAQQLAIIRSVVADLDIPVRIIGAPIIREADGLAMSSRNRYLTPDQRQAARILHQALTHGAVSDTPVEATRAMLKGVDVDYVALRNAHDFAEWDGTSEAYLLVAARFGTTRLLDNLKLPAVEPAHANP